MHIKWQHSHDILKRLVQCLAVAGITVFIGVGIVNSGTEYSIPTLIITESELPEDTETEFETEPATAKSSETAGGSLAAEKTDNHSGVTAPYANPVKSSFSIIDDLVGVLQLHPNYLPSLALKSLSWKQLETEITEMTKSYSGEWSVYIKDLSNGETISIHDQPMDSASLIKLFVMGAVMEQLNNGTLAESKDINTLLDKMITISDNSATNTLVRYLDPDKNHSKGMDVVNNFAARHGFSNTRHINGLNDSRLWTSTTETNHTSARDCGEFLAAVYDGRLISHLASRKMESLLLAQEVTYKIPTALPPDAVSANKTGETDSTENDSAIVYSQGGDFILCIMSENWDNKNQAVNRLREITKLTYRYFNPEEN